jgi:hypothetical protein
VPKYLVKQRAEVWYEIGVIAENEAEAKSLANDLLMEGVGLKVKDSFVWEDDYEVEVTNE